MVQRSTTAESGTTTPSHLTRLAGAFDPSKVMENFTKFLGIYKVPGIDVQAALESSRKNVEALATANKQAIEGFQAVLTRQEEILRETMDEVSAALAELSSAKSPPDAAAKQGELVTKAMEKVLNNMRDITEMMLKSNTKAFDIIKTRVSESVGEIKQMTATLRK